jgi:nitroimidazol reductase NimA-like FMN-containing flavoprotein (pyridoxamine 5'-phosphate oxidase superfamily)
MSDQDLAARARAIVDANRYLTLATADEAGVPWATPVWYAAVDGREFLWASRPEARHSRNVAARAQVAIVIYDSTVPVGGAQAVYVAAEAHELTGAEVDRGIAAYSAEGEAQGLEPWTREHVQPPAPLRLYRAVAHECFVLGSGDERIPVEL